MSTLFLFIATTNPDDITDPEHTLGIEVTTPAVAEHCRRGNIDEQHGYGTLHLPSDIESLLEIRRALGWVKGPDDDHLLERPAERAAIVAAVSIAVPAQMARQVPDLYAGSADSWRTLATTRPDLDSIGAMAVIVLRSIGLWPGEGIWSFYPTEAERPVYERVRAVAEADAFTPAAAWAPSPLPTEENPWPRAGSVDSSEGLAHLGMICSPRRGDVALPLAERVAVVALWLLFGEPIEGVDGDGLWPSDCGEVAKIREACGCPEGREHRHLANVILGAKQRVLMSRRALAAEAQRPGAVVVDDGDRIAVVRVAHAGAMGLGYCVAPVVVAFDQGMTWGIYGKWDLGVARGGAPEGEKSHPADSAVYPSREAAEAMIPKVAEYVFAQQGHPVPPLWAIQASPRKVTIAAYAPNYLNVAALKTRLNILEHAERESATTCANGGDFQERADMAAVAFHAGDRWGGGATIIGSPQKYGTELSETAILEAVRACLGANQ